MKHTELKQGDVVLFKRYCDILEREDYQEGNVIFVNDKQKEVCICYLEGYKSRSDEIPYDKVIAKYDLNGIPMTFGIYSGGSILLEM